MNDLDQEIERFTDLITDMCSSFTQTLDIINTDLKEINEKLEGKIWAATTPNTNKALTISPGQMKI